MPDQEVNKSDPCAPNSKPGPVREAGGTTGAGNLSPDQANRTGGTTSGVDPKQKTVPEARRGVKPDA